MFSAGMKHFSRAGVKACLAILVVWAGLFFSESLSKPSGLSSPNKVTLFMTVDGTITGSETPISVPLRADPLYDYKDPAGNTGEPLAIGVFRISFDIIDQSQATAVFFTSRYEINEIRLNGRLLKGQSPTDPQGTLSGYGPTAYVFPSEFINAGENVLLVKSSGRTYKSLPLYYIGDANIILRAVAWGKFFAFDLVSAAIAMMLFVILMCILVDWQIEDRQKINILILLMASWTLRNLSILGVFDTLPLPFLRITTYVLSYLPVIVIAHFAVVWTNVWNTLRVRNIFFGLYTIIVFLPIVIVSLGIRRVYGISIPWMIDNVLTITFTVFAFVVFFLYLWRGKREDTVEIIIFLICTLSLFVDKMDNIFHIQMPFSENVYLTFYFAPLCGLLLGLGMCASIAAEATRARRVAMNINQTLESKLAQREQSIRSNAKSRAVVEERRRIMQDMHDGLGARLSGIILRTRSKSLAYKEVPDAIQESLDELRLIIDSLDSAGDTLAISMGAFRERVEDQFIASGISLNWDIQQDATQAEYSANTVLQIYRIMQEASSNTIKHSNATHIHIALRCRYGDRKYPYEILIQDNGRGFGEGEGMRSNGKGIESMESRSERINGTLKIESLRTGVTLLLKLPPPNGNGSSRN